ncbi:MAG TPA: UbiX family flavin prenyltransferase [Syntrophothermus lipocalidus]|uniref:Flavin prenyltransferase UbiX n=2 Tax=Syntrophothermus TaxID=129001 RepID=D7CNB6_SYNLT|nr:flavin prenyltransferase UbiX [Syntrophothermus lipocalidus]ADI02201.1 3-octaprenyl-4-hydroxybenzoate carboxy-lyase [Syntrophothermus lipocalidus DSM 12680]HHV75956.1 UbiX family flavin prenyltransferase [Syntrophothermus lipocalidus]HOV43399.1 flavin prenyltransferase UbiX [Syntrophothermus lipocalidus]
MDNRFILGITGASGVIYGVRLAEELLAREFEVHLIVSNPARVVLAEELGWDIEQEVVAACRQGIRGCFENGLFVYENHEIWAPPASGSFRVRGMIIAPCSMSTLAGIANGLSANLVQRAADVVLKERRPLIMVPRETPLSAIHLKNMLELARLGASIVPAMPGFYHKPQSIQDLVDFVVGKVLDLLEIDHDLFRRYEGGSSSGIKN